MKNNVLTVGLLLAGAITFAQTNSSVEDSLKTQELEEVFVRSTRAGVNTPMAYSTIKKASLDKVNLGQDLPILLNLSPSMVTTSDAGAGVGYTGMRIRGSDASRINVTINGVPLNDSESQGVYWVNMPDFASTVSSIQIQRGVGTSTNGAGAFGATVNLATNNPSTESFVQINNSYGSFNTRKHNLILNSGLLNGHWAFEGRLSQIASDGYIDRAWSDLKSYYLSGGYYGNKTIIKALAFGGQEETYQAWYGTPEVKLYPSSENALQSVIDNSGEYLNQVQKDNLNNSGRTFNYYTYDNQIDHYNQDHYQLHLSHQLSENWNLTTAMHYTYGRGYFEEFISNEHMEYYGYDLTAYGIDTVATTDLIQRRWLDNHFGGLTYSLDYTSTKLNATLGGGYNYYDGDHFGEVIWSRVSHNSSIHDQYYDNNATKSDFNSYLKVNYQLTERLQTYVDLQVRSINYTIRDVQPTDLINEYLFFNPKAGLTYVLENNQQLYASYAQANREPMRSDFLDSSETPQHETLHDMELGYRKHGEKWSASANGYYMFYKNQLVLTGELNNDGGNIRANVGESYRAGIELEGTIQIIKKLAWNVNATLSKNKNKKYIETLIDYLDYSTVYNSYKDTDISFSPGIIIGSTIAYTPFKNFEIQWMSKYVGEQYLDNTSNDDRSIDAYFIDDIRLGYSFSTKSIKNIGVTLLVNNVFNQEYSSNGYTWGHLYDGSQYQQNNYYPQAGTNFLASLSLKF